MKQRFRMLISDDCYEDTRNAENHLLDVFCSMKKALAIEDGKLIAEYVVDGWYKTDNFPISKFTGADIRVTDNAEAMIRESQGDFDWIVSDLDYGHGREEDGIYIMSRIQNPRAVKAIFTSGSDKRRLEQLKSRTNVDYFIAPAFSQREEYVSKTELLGEIIAKHYQKDK